MFERVERAIDRGAPAPVWRGELYFETHRGTLTSQIETKLGNRRCERLLVEAELWAATLGRPAEVDHLWKQVLTQQFHDILPGSSIAWAHDDAEAVFAEVGAELEARIATLLADAVGPGRALANPADAAISEVVVLDAERIDVAGEHRQILADGHVAVFAEVPALGVSLFEPRPVDDRVVLSDSSMTNGHLAVRWDNLGNIISIIDLASAREIVPPGEVMAALELAVDQPVEYDAWDLESWTRSGGVPLTGRPTTSTWRSSTMARWSDVSRSPGPSAPHGRWSPTSCAPTAHNCSCTSSSTGTTTNTCSRWHFLSTYAATWRCATSSSVWSPVRRIRRVRGTPPSSRCAPTASSMSPNPTSAWRS